jgi:hypothetical protein
VSALAALVFGALAVIYAVWPALRGREVERLADVAARDAAAATAEARANRAWSEAAGELEPEGRDSREYRNQPGVLGGGSDI